MLLDCLSAHFTKKPLYLECRIYLTELIRDWSHYSRNLLLIFLYSSFNKAMSKTIRIKCVECSGLSLYRSNKWINR